MSRPDWDLANGWLGGTRGHHQPEGHRSSREIHPVLHGMVCYSPLQWRLPSGYERLHRYVTVKHNPSYDILGSHWLKSLWTFTCLQTFFISVKLSPSGRKSGQQGLGASRLPVFSPQEKSYVKGTCDFLGLGHFTTRYVTTKNYPAGVGDSYFADRDLAELVDPQWPDPGSEWLYSVPWGFRRLLNFVKVRNKIWRKSRYQLW